MQDNEVIESVEQEEELEEAGIPGAGKNKDGMKKVKAEVDDVGTDPTVNDASKPEYTKSVNKAASNSAPKTSVKEQASKMSLIKSIYDKLDEMSREEVEEVLGALNEVDDAEEITEEQIMKYLLDEGYTEQEIADMSEEDIASILEGMEKTSKKETAEKKAVIAKEDMEADLAGDVQALIEGEELSDEFKEKAATIFEAAVFARVNEEIANRVEKLEEQYQVELEKAINENRSSMIEKIDDFMNYVIKEWMEENQLAIDKGIRSEVVEDFMVGLKNLFVEHYIDIPDEKVDLVDDLFAKVEDLEESLNSEIQKNIETAKELKEYKKMDVMYTVSEGLTEVEIEKLQKLSEGISFNNEEEYAEKLNMIKENYFKSNEKQQVLTEGTVEDELNETSHDADDSNYGMANEAIRRYADAISRTLKK
jgi:hypothetical protein